MPAWHRQARDLSLPSNDLAWGLIGDGTDVGDRYLFGRLCRPWTIFLGVLTQKGRYRSTRLPDWLIENEKDQTKKQGIMD